MTTQEAPHESDPEVAALLERILAKSAALRLPELFKTPPAGALYHLPDRHGVSVVALRTTDLSHDQLLAILTYRLAQYVVLGYLNTRVVYEAGLEHESPEYVDPGDVHFLAGAAESGEILCYMVLKGALEAAPGTTMRTCERALFPIDQIFGWVYTIDFESCPTFRSRVCASSSASRRISTGRLWTI